MHEHNNDKSSDSKMMWMMMLCCALPIILILILGSENTALRSQTWIIIGGIAIMIFTHLFMTGKSHKHSNDGLETTGGKDKNDSGHGCCH